MLLVARTQHIMAWLRSSSEAGADVLRLYSEVLRSLGLPNSIMFLSNKEWMMLQTLPHWTILCACWDWCHEGCAHLIGLSLSCLAQSVPGLAT